MSPADTGENRRAIRRTALILAGVAALFYFGFILAGSCQALPGLERIVAAVCFK